MEIKIHYYFLLLLKTKQKRQIKKSNVEVS